MNFDMILKRFKGLEHLLNITLIIINKKRKLIILDFGSKVKKKIEKYLNLNLISLIT